MGRLLDRIRRAALEEEQAQIGDLLDTHKENYMTKKSGGGVPIKTGAITLNWKVTR